MIKFILGFALWLLFWYLLYTWTEILFYQASKGWFKAREKYKKEVIDINFNNNKK